MKNWNKGSKIWRKKPSTPSGLSNELSSIQFPYMIVRILRKAWQKLDLTV